MNKSICTQYIVKPIGSMYGIFTYIYHKNQPFMYVNIPSPWILWETATSTSNVNSNPFPGTCKDLLCKLLKICRVYLGSAQGGSVHWRSLQNRNEKTRKKTNKVKGTEKNPAELIRNLPICPFHSTT